MLAAASLQYSSLLLHFLLEAFSRSSTVLHWSPAWLKLCDTRAITYYLLCTFVARPHRSTLLMRRISGHGAFKDRACRHLMEVEHTI